MSLIVALRLWDFNRLLL